MKKGNKIKEETTKTFLVSWDETHHVRALVTAKDCKEAVYLAEKGEYTFLGCETFDPTLPDSFVCEGEVIR